MAEAGARFESYVRTAMAEGDLPSLAELARRSGIAASAWHGWFRGERHPRKNSLTLAGQALGRSPEQLLAAWDGAPARRAATQSRDPLVSAITLNTEALNELVGLLRPLVEERDEQEARLRALEAEMGSLRVRPADEGSPERSVPHESGR
jgi:transcriptional regulator with XRE-family HTH domain